MEHSTFLSSPVWSRGRRPDSRNDSREGNWQMTVQTLLRRYDHSHARIRGSAVVVLRAVELGSKEQL